MLSMFVYTCLALLAMDLANVRRVAVSCIKLCGIWISESNNLYSQKFMPKLGINCIVFF